MLNWVTGMSERGSRYHRHQLPQRAVADHDAGGMGRGMAEKPLELLRGFSRSVPTTSFLLDLFRKARLGLDGVL